MPLVYTMEQHIVCMRQKKQLNIYRVIVYIGIGSCTLRKRSHSNHLYLSEQEWRKCLTLRYSPYEEDLIGTEKPT